MSIVLLIRSLNFGGAERQLVELAKGLAKRGHDVLAVVFYADGQLLGELEEAGVPVRVLGKRGRWDVWSFVPRVARVMRAQRPHVVYAFMTEPSLLAIALKPVLSGARVVWGVRVSNIDFDRYGWFPRLTFRLSRWLARSADLIIANSWAGAAHHEALGYPPSRIVVVPNGVDVSRFRPDTDAGRRQRARWGIPADARVIGLVGRLDPMKDHETLLTAAQVLQEEGDRNLWYVCVGDGPAPFRAQLERRAAELGVAQQFRWVGGETDMVASYNALDVLCLCSAYGEGFSNALAEGMACGIPCVATDVGDAARILEGLPEIVPRRDPRALAAALHRAVTAPSTGAALRGRVQDRFSVDRMVTETERLLQACVNGS